VLWSLVFQHRLCVSKTPCTNSPSVSPRFCLLCIAKSQKSLFLRFIRNLRAQRKLFRDLMSGSSDRNLPTFVDYEDLQLKVGSSSGSARELKSRAETGGPRDQCYDERKQNEGSAAP